MANRLQHETSPYLRQHADNPVDWHPWGEEAFAEARRRDVPIFLSVGYSTCHWCHVMAHESFEDPEIARRLNETLVCVKVDREERPDVDAVYMSAVQGMTGHGGWPMSVFATPDGEPFYAGTYWPRERRHGMPAFPEVVEAVVDAWQQRREEVASSAARISEALAEAGQSAREEALDDDLADAGARLVVEQAWDRVHGGFGRAPKFPQAMVIEWLLEHHARTGEPDPRDAAAHALRAMARGGIHDQLAGGFARYSTDDRWLVPHFEKMLYDNALLLSAYATGAAVTGDAELRETAFATAGYLLGELRTEEGLFHAAVDADSEGVEGRYYVWSHDELAEVVAEAGADPDRWARLLGVTPAGNWEGVNVLHRPVTLAEHAEETGADLAELEAEDARVRAALLARRQQRVPPSTDTKVLTSWNAWTARALVRAGWLLDEPGWVAAGATTATALHELLVADGRLHHVRAAGHVHTPALLEDVAGLALADLELLAATGHGVWLERARALAEDAEARFADPEGGWFQTPEDGEELLLRPKDLGDNATPAGTSVMVEVCLRLAAATGEGRWHDRALDGVLAFQRDARRAPPGFGWLLRQVEALVDDAREVAIVGRPSAARDALADAARRVRPGTLVVVADEGDEQVPLLAGRGEVEARPAAYVCRGLVCERPVTDPDALAAQLAD